MALQHLPFLMSYEVYYSLGKKTIMNTDLDILLKSTSYSQKKHNSRYEFGHIKNYNRSF